MRFRCDVYPNLRVLVRAEPREFVQFAQGRLETENEAAIAVLAGHEYVYEDDGIDLAYCPHPGCGKAFGSQRGLDAHSKVHMRRS